MPQKESIKEELEKLGATFGKMQAKPKPTVPEGYFENLRAELNQIPSRSYRSWKRPFVSLAASVLLLAAMGWWLWSHNAAHSVDDSSSPSYAEYVMESLDESDMVLFLYPTDTLVVDNSEIEMYLKEEDILYELN